jgi:hypothetical protein
MLYATSPSSTCMPGTSFSGADDRQALDTRNLGLDISHAKIAYVIFCTEMFSF